MRRGALVALVIVCVALSACAGQASQTAPPSRSHNPLKVHANGPVSPQPEVNGVPVLATPGPAQQAYVETQRQRLPWVVHPPTRVAVAGSIVSAGANGMLVNIPQVSRSAQDANTTFYPIPAEAVPGSNVQVTFAPTTDFLVAHGQQSLAPGSDILVMGINEGSTIRAVLVTDGSGVRNSGTVTVAASSLRRVRSPTVVGFNAQLASLHRVAATGDASPELVGRGSWGLDGINVGLNNIGFGTPGNSCPYFTFQATVIAGFGAQWNFNEHLALDSSGNLTVSSDPAGGSAASLNGTVDHTYYSAFGGGLQWGVQLGCDTPIPIPSVTFFGQTFGGGHVGLDFSYGDDWSALLENQSDAAVPLWGDQALTVPGVQCVDELSSDNIPEIGTLLAKIHGPAITVPICAAIDINPAGFRASLHVNTSAPTQVGTQGIALGDHQSALVNGLAPNATLDVGSYNFVPVQDFHLTAGVELGRPEPKKPSGGSSSSSSTSSGQKPKPVATAICKDGSKSYAQNSQGQCSQHGGIGQKLPTPNPLATAICKDGSQSYAQNSQGQCSHHGGIAQKVDPSSSPTSSNADQSPDSSWTDLADGHISFGPWNIPFLGGSEPMTVQWDPDTVRFAIPSDFKPPTGEASCSQDTLVALEDSQIGRLYPTNEFSVKILKTIKGDPEWASFQIAANPGYVNTVQGAVGVAACSPSAGWKTRDLGGVFVGCNAGIPSSVLSQLGAPFGCPPSVQAGHDSPKDAVEGYFSEVQRGDAAASCSYLQPSVQSTCEGFAGSEPTTTGTFTPVSQVVNGSKALVGVVGQLCQVGSPCASNTDANTGMPSATRSFASAYAAAVSAASGSAMVLSPIPCIEVNGQWYLNFDTGSSGNTGTSGTGSTGTGSTGTGNSGTGSTGTGNSGTGSPSGTTGNTGGL